MLTKYKNECPNFPTRGISPYHNIGEVVKASPNFFDPQSLEQFGFFDGRRSAYLVWLSLSHKSQ